MNVDLVGRLPRRLGDPNGSGLKISGRLRLATPRRSQGIYGLLASILWFIVRLVGLSFPPQDYVLFLPTKIFPAGRLHTARVI
jgi:hypothetical protein